MNLRSEKIARLLIKEPLYIYSIFYRSVYHRSLNAVKYEQVRLIICGRTSYRGDLLSCAERKTESLQARFTYV